jgi:hypothetical protein
MAMLGARVGEVVTYGELQQAGVEFPASVVSELELSGVALERCTRPGTAGAHGPGVRLLAGSAAAPAPSLPSPQPQASARGPEASPPRPAAPPAPAARPRLRRPERQDLAPPQARPRRVGRSAAALALALVVCAVAAIALSTGGGAAVHPQPTPIHRALRARGAHRAGGATVPVSELLAAQLEARGHQALVEGDYGAAIPQLRRALAASGESVQGCLQPTSEACLTYAYALFDLGHALALQGHGAAALRVLESRLRIANQQPTVAGEIAKVRAGSG